MPTRSLRKVQKHVIKKKGRNTALHQQSRDSQRLRRASAREEKLNRVAGLRAKSNEHVLERLAFFQNLAGEKNAAFNLEEIQDGIALYLHRHDNEMDQLKAERRQGRPPSSRQDNLARLQEEEQKEYVSGFWIPDLQDASNVARLVDWNGDLAALTVVKFSRVRNDGMVRESKYPPKHDS